MTTSVPRAQIADRVLTDLRAIAIRSFLSIPKRGVEVGGILFGRARNGEIQIESFEEVPSEHRYGPSYALSEEDRAQLTRQLAACARVGRPVVGFFRSFTGREPLLEEADEAYIREHFSKGDFVVLQLQPKSAEECTASWRFFHDGAPVGETDEPVRAIPAPAIPARTMPPSYRSREQAQEAEEAQGAQDASEPAAPAAPSVAFDSAPPRRAGWLLPTLLCLVLGAGGAVIYELWGLARQPRWTPLHLDARPDHGRLDLSWDVAAARALHATRASLEITDGEARRAIPLNPAQMLSGHYSLTPLYPDVAVRLLLYEGNLGVAGDAIRVAGLPMPKVQTAADATVVPSNAPPPRGDADRAATPRATVAVPPLIVHEVQPRIPEGIRSRLTDSVAIPVEVQVSAQGRVTAAKAENQSGDAVRRYLAEQAEKAARQWRFAPAKARNGTRVAAAKTIHFVFTP